MRAWYSEQVWESVERSVKLKLLIEVDDPSLIGDVNKLCGKNLTINSGDLVKTDFSFTFAMGGSMKSWGSIKRLKDKGCTIISDADSTKAVGYLRALANRIEEVCAQ
tara:strand:+ start:1474 stop:1794 length:321 start_codon:yes stop_codon:yes gene_type:complete